jgi:hypothetical protein
MKTLKYLTLMVFIVSLFTSCQKTESSSLQKENLRYPIYPVSNGWKPARVKDVQAVAISVASVLMKDFPQKRFTPIILENREAGPRTLYKRGRNNEYIVWIDMKGTMWDKLSYQFSHELGHILANYANQNRRNQWFEEALMETVSLYTLEKMSIEWQYNPPYPHWKSYASSLKKYLDNMLKERHRVVNEDLSIWYKKHESSLRGDPYIRDKNEVVATAIYHLIEVGKFKISTIQYLNLGTPDKNKPFSTYLREWYENSPDENRESVLNVIELLGITI